MHLKSDTITYLFGFNGKENDNEVNGDGNQQDYGMRIYDNRLGRFFSVDPLFKEYPWNSTYSFGENDVIRCIDLDGMGKVVVIMEQHPEKHEFESNANYLESQGYTVLRCSTGEELIKALEDYSATNEPIDELVILSHSSRGALYGLNGNNNGLYTQTWFDQATGSDPGLNQEEEKEKFRSNGARTVCDLAESVSNNKIKFSESANILFGGCNAGGNWEDEMGIAQVTSIELNVTTIGADGRTWDLGQNAQQGEISAGVCSTRSCREAEFGWNKYSPNGDGTASKTELSSGGTGINDKNRSLSNGRIQKMDVSKTKTE